MLGHRYTFKGFLLYAGPVYFANQEACKQLGEGSADTLNSGVRGEFTQGNLP